MFDAFCKIFIKNHKDYENESVRERYGTFSGIVGILVNALLSVIKLIIGVLSASIAIIADSMNNLSDAGASLVSIISFKLASKPADREHPFGHARIEYVASMIVSFLILIVGFETLTGAVEGAVSFIKGESEKNTSVTYLTFIILLISVIFKLVLAAFYRFVGKRINSSVILASAVDSVSDAVSTAVVLASSIIIKVTNWVLIDSIMGAVVSVLILVAGFKILNETKNSLLGDAPVDETVNKIKEIVGECPYIIGMHDLLVHNYGPNRFIASFHAEVNGSDDIYALHDAIDNVEREIQEKLGILCTIHMDPIITDDTVVDSMRSFVKGVIDELDLNVGFHDFRVVIGETHTNLIFDIVVPFEIKNADDLKDEISKRIHSLHNDYYAVITVDRA
jgi:cation diffusion facilitator family transporter